MGYSFQIDQGTIADFTQNTQVARREKEQDGQDGQDKKFIRFFYPDYPVLFDFLKSLNVRWLCRRVLRQGRGFFGQDGRACQSIRQFVGVVGVLAGHDEDLYRRNPALRDGGVLGTDIPERVV